MLRRFTIKQGKTLIKNIDSLNCKTKNKIHYEKNLLFNDGTCPRCVN